MSGSPGRRSVRFGLVSVFLLCLAAFVFWHQILWRMGALLVNAGAPVKADIVVVIGGDWLGNRILKGAELVREGYAPRLLASGVGPMYGSFESELAVNYAVAHGYSRADFLALHYPAVSTVDEARAVIPRLRALGVHHFVLVTSEYHTARAGRIFRREARDLSVDVVASSTNDWHGGEWWKDREGRKLWFNEAVKTIADYLGI
jgi:uncharacterized SAM-binding protein YcdF (DUF218 family)